MRDPITAQQFHDSDGIDDWRVVTGGASAVYRTASLTEGAAFTTRVATIADELDHHPDIDLRARRVALCTTTHSEKSLTELDVLLAQRIQVVARELDLEPDPAAVQTVFFAVDAAQLEPVRDFWQAALGYRQRHDLELVDPLRRGPLFWFSRTELRADRGRIHVDISVAHDVAEARVQSVLDAGGRLLGDKHAPAWWSLIDADGNVADITTSQGE